MPNRSVARSRRMVRASAKWGMGPRDYLPDEAGLSGTDELTSRRGKSIASGTFLRLAFNFAVGQDFLDIIRQTQTVFILKGSDTFEVFMKFGGNFAPLIFGCIQVL